MEFLTRCPHHAGGYQKELLKVIDPEELPAFLGGKMTDPDGNIRCTSKVRRSVGQEQKSTESPHKLHKNTKTLLSYISRLFKVEKFLRVFTCPSCPIKPT